MSPTDPAPLDTIIRNGLVLTDTAPPAPGTSTGGHAHFAESHSIGIRNGQIAWVKPDANVEAAEIGHAEQIDARGQLVIPGLLNGHTHSPMTVFRGSAEDVPTASWFNERIWPMEVNLTRRDVHLGARVAVAEMLLGGVTSFADHYFHADSIAQVAADSGARALIASTFFSSQDEDGLEASADFVARWNGAADGRITAALGPHATYTVNDHDLVRTAERARELGVRVHIHAAENLEQTRASLDKCGATPIRVLYDTGILDAGAIIAHGVGILEEDVPLLQQYADRVAVASCTKNYMKHAMGVGTPLRMLHDAGITVGIGTDGAASNNTLDVLESLRFLTLLNKNREEDATWLTMTHALDLLTRQSAALFGAESTLGTLRAGYKADIVLIDLQRPHAQPVHDPAATLVLSSRSSDVTTVLVDGRILVRSGRLVDGELHDVYDELAARRSALTDRTHGRSIQEYAP